MSDNDLYYSKIGKVHTAQEEEANALLADGWVLIGPTNIPVVTHQKEGGDIVTTTPAFNLGLRRNDIAQPAAKTSAPATNSPATSILQLANRVSWKESAKNPDFSWAWAVTKDPDKYPLPKEVVDLANLLRKAGKEIRDGQYSYMLSKDGQYLNRIRHKEEPEHPQ
ncbi:MAG: hypothetical protein JRM78_04385 [Nitrososphaerota archaeon]|nr:hypothetical protein [Nitrososphaerota archaeon]